MWHNNFLKTQTRYIIMEFQKTRNKNNISKRKNRVTKPQELKRISPVASNTGNWRWYNNAFKILRKHFYNIDFYTQPCYPPIKLAIKYKGRIRASKFSKKTMGARFAASKQWNKTKIGKRALGNRGTNTEERKRVFLQW